MRPILVFLPCCALGASLADLWDEDSQEYEYLFTRMGEWLVRKSEYGRDVGAWHHLELGDNERAKMGALYQAEEHKPAKAPAKVRKAPKKAAQVARADPFAEALAALQALPASKQDKVLPALKALLEMAEG